MKLHFVIPMVTVLLLNTIRVSYGQDVDYRAYTLFVYNFMKYIEWPHTMDNQFVVGVYGDSPIIGELENLAKTKKVQGKTIVVKKLLREQDALNCQLVYIISSKSTILKTLATHISNKPVLVVCEREGMAKKGAHVSFVTMEDDQLKFDINKTLIEKNSLKIPAQLVSLGFLVG